MKHPLRGFYAVLDRDDEALARVLAAGACALQVRIKPRGKRVDTDEIVRVARMARSICDAVDIPLVVNDRVDVALAVGADGVHLGQTDLPIADARAICGDRLWIGVSTHDLAQVRAACGAGADYIGFGPVFPTATKENPDRVQGLGGLRAAVAAATVPVVAIGGITVDRAPEVYAAGASAICAISAVNEARDVAVAVAALRSTA
jgi:thiamine-phosphate pyrophosphorylase